MLSAEQLTGKDETHLESRDGVSLHADCWAAFDALRNDAAHSGLDLQIASGFRSFQRQLQIWNAKASGQRSVHDDDSREVDMRALSEIEQVHAILRFSALPGASRHHWGSDLDLFDAAAIPEGYQLQLSPAEFASDGMFGPLHQWLEERISSGDCHGFFRPYDQDRGGVAVERWHLSFAPVANDCAAALDLALLRACLSSCELALADTVSALLETIYDQYISLPPAPL